MGVAWRSMRDMPLRSLAVLAGAAGAVAGVASWGLAVAVHTTFGAGKPGLLSLVLAVPRGALFGVILAWILHAWWKRHPGKIEA